MGSPTASTTKQRVQGTIDDLVKSLAGIGIKKKLEDISCELLIRHKHVYGYTIHFTLENIVESTLSKLVAIVIENGYGKVRFDGGINSVEVVVSVMLDSKVNP